MNWWLKLAAKKGVDQVVKDRLRSSPFFAALFQKHNVDMATLDGLAITVAPLEGIFCKTDGDSLIIDDDLVKTKQVFGPKFHYIAHEILHFLKRQVGAESHPVQPGEYFADPEEVEAFATAIAYSMYVNREQKNLGKLLQKEFLPLIKVTMPNDAEARKFFVDRLSEAKGMLSSMSLCNFS